MKSKINILRSEEIPVDEKIVSYFFSAAEKIDEMAKASGIKKPLDMNVISNMAGHPKSGALEIGTDGFTRHEKATLLGIGVSVLGVTASVIAKNYLAWE